MSSIKSGSIVIHEKYGQCSVRFIDGETAVIKTNTGLQECSITELVPLKTVFDGEDSFSSAKALLRVEGNVIEAINNTWGIFSQTAISLLPHQLWVCNQTMKKWPIRMMIADDVGLGKTIEAGLILTSAISSGKAKRILILTPAKLTKQWHDRMKDMFGLNFDVYSSATDRLSKSEFDKDRLIGSLATIRLNSGDKHQRILEAEPWDIVMVDEAHHAGMSKEKQTLGFKLLDMMLAAQKIKSLIFFTATPHQGKPEQFWKLMSLLDSEAFSEDVSDKERYARLPEFMIRNNKARVTDMNGELLFKGLRQHPGVFHYTPKEAKFYELMSDYISNGFAYAGDLEDENEGRHVGLVLNALQKIASSSIAAIRSALRNRLAMLEGEEVLNNESIDPESDDEEIAEKPFMLMNEEKDYIEELLSVAEGITEESGINRIIEIINTDYPEDSVLLFTEYKATQALMIKALRSSFGQDSVCFINGDDALYIDGHKEVSSRESAMKDFNRGTKRFLVSTEASGEGVDLQDNCHVLIHVDLPWNPMRLHQRVGRIFRFGQKKDVDVVTLRNPDNLESKIWDLLDEKCSEINKAFGHVMDTPEDMKQMVLGIEDTGFYTSLFSEGLRQSKKGFDKWFDKRTQHFGDKSAIETIRGIETQAARFNLTDLAEVPKFSLLDLKPFLENTFRVHGKTFKYDAAGTVMNFNMPDEWLVRNPNYIDPIKYMPKRFVFSRESKDMGSIPAVRNRFFDKALEDARNYTDTYAVIPGSTSYLIIRVYEKVTTNEPTSYFTFVGYAVYPNGNTEKIGLSELFRTVRDLLKEKYPESETRENRTFMVTPDKAEELRLKALGEYQALGIEYSKPEAEVFALLDAEE